MKLSIRTKIFITLLIFSLGPMLITRTITGKKSSKLAEELTEQTKVELLEIMSSELEHSAVSLLTLLETSGHTLELAVRTIADQATLYLDATLPPSEARPIFASNFNKPFQNTSAAPEDSGYKLHTKQGLRVMEIDKNAPAFRLPHNADDMSIRNEQIQRLLGLTPTLKNMYTALNDYSVWLNIGLESGVFMTYPGHGRFPMMYDHRDEKWYHKAQIFTDGEVHWNAPAIDPARRLAVATGSIAIRDDDGNFLGAASIDIPMASIVRSEELKSRWSGEIKSFMIVSSPRREGGPNELQIVAQQAYDQAGHRHWMSGIETEWLESDDKEAFAAFRADIMEKKSGTMSLPYKGKPSLWAFASNKDYLFVLIAPESVISMLPDEVTGSLTWLFGQMRNISLIISGVVFVLITLIAWFGSKAVSKPLLSMADKARRLASGDFSVRMKSRTGDERDVLIESFNHMVPKLQEHMDLSRDMELAHEVQTLLLPPENPTLLGFDISGGISYCDQTGGDYYDFIDVKSDNGFGLGVVLGDVAGHGVPAALIMAEARGLLNALSTIDMTPAERMNRVNHQLSLDLDGTGRFITMFYMRLRENHSTVRWVRAGHDPAFRYCPATDIFSELGGEGLALGVLPEYHFTDYEATLEAGEVLVMATDGVWEARNTAGEMFGKERVLAIIRENAHNCAEDIRIAIMNTVAQYEAGGQEDDIAVVVVKKV